MAMSPKARLATAVVVVIIWAAITLFGGLAQAGQGTLAELVSKQIVFATPAAALFLLIAASIFGWNDLGLNGPRPRSSVWLFWLLALYIAVLGAIAVLTKDLVLAVVLAIAINTAFVGFSEELAFRGVLWGAARKAIAFWPGVLLVSGMFGGVHILNAFMTGHLGEASLQALNAFLSGLAYLALRIRSRSIWPILIAHWLWDMMIFLNAPRSIEPSASTTNPLVGIMLVAPIAAYGLWLLRKPEFRHIDDAHPTEGIRVDTRRTAMESAR